MFSPFLFKLENLVGRFATLGLKHFFSWDLQTVRHLNRLPHLVQEKFISPVWTGKCSLSLVNDWKTLLQYLHLRLSLDILSAFGSTPSLINARFFTLSNILLDFRSNDDCAIEKDVFISFLASLVIETFLSTLSSSALHFLTCTARSPLYLNFMLHFGQEYLFSPVCLIMWSAKSPRHLPTQRHIKHVLSSMLNFCLFFDCGESDGSSFTSGSEFGSFVNLLLSLVVVLVSLLQYVWTTFLSSLTSWTPDPSTLSTCIINFAESLPSCFPISEPEKGFISLRWFGVGCWIGPDSLWTDPKALTTLSIACSAVLLFLLSI